MGQGVRMLEKAIDIAYQEMAALESGEYDEAGRWASKRGELVNKAWGLLKTDKDQYMPYLLNLTRLQERLTLMATEAKNNITGGLRRSRDERKRMQGYRRSVAQALQ
ncbi:MAG: hypothetical protein LBR22_08410 [Desulfovibrio sp.]|jgi:hypothetical protein|nr:hypothetical protein [Desulfovibrio sp.]